MEYIFIIIMIATIIGRFATASKKKVADAEKQRKLQAQLEEEEAIAAERRREYAARMNRERKPLAPTVSARVAPTQGIEIQSSEGFGSMEGTSGFEGPNRRHVVKPMTESSHFHTESSITGIAEYCPPENPLQHLEANHATAYEVPAAHGGAAGAFNLNRNSLAQGILYAEVLGKPKAAYFFEKK